MISNGNRTELGPIWSVIIRVMNKIGLPRSRSPIYLITSIITDRIRRQEVLLPFNHHLNKICDILGSFEIKTQQNLKIFLASGKKKNHLVRALAMARTVQAVYTAISRTIVGKSARDNPERHCGWF